MEREAQILNKERKHGDGLIDRSKVRILLCDNVAKSSEEVFNLLLKCSYQVTSVKSARQVIDALNAEGPDIDIILAEVDLPMKKGMKMLKYITRDEELRRIPVIMMSAKDEVSVVFKCLRLGAADYLVKPLRTNELLNLWTHMWRRRHMLGLAEKNILSYDFDRVTSDPSDANTNSTTLFSDDTDDKSQTTNPEMGVANHQKDEFTVGVTVSVAPAIVELSPGEPLENRCNIDEMRNCQTGQLSSGPKKSQLKIGASSAFFTYVKSSTIKNNFQGIAHIGIATQTLRMEGKSQLCDQQETGDARVYANGEACKSYSQEDDFRSSSSIPSSVSLEQSCTLPLSQEFRNSKEENIYQVPRHQRNDLQLEASGSCTQSMYPCYMSGIVNQVPVPSSAQLCQKNLLELPSHAITDILPQYNHLQQCPPHMAGVTSIPYYPPSLCLQPGQIPSQSWQSFGSSASPDVILNKVDKREAALMKFRQKRKERCFHKKIRYVNRKKLAERRPRVRGQFVRKVNGVSLDLNGQPATADYDEQEEEDEDELASRDSSPEDDASGS